MDGIFVLREAQKLCLKAFLCGQRVFGLLPTGFGKLLAKHKR